MGKRPRGRKYCSTASHAARNGVQATKGLVFSYLEHPNTSESVWGEEKFWIQLFLEELHLSIVNWESSVQS